MTPFTVRGKTVIVVIHGPATDFKQLLPTASRLLATLRFPG
jgi:hypothetical protein